MNHYKKLEIESKIKKYLVFAVSHIIYMYKQYMGTLKGNLYEK